MRQLGSMRSRMSDPIRRIDDSLEQYVAVAKAIEDAEEDHAVRWWLMLPFTLLSITPVWPYKGIRSIAD